MTLLAGCSKQETPVQRAANAKALFEKATKEFHIPSAEANGAEQRQFQDRAAAMYGQLLRQYPEQSNLCAEALCSLGNIYAAQTNVAKAVETFSAVAVRYGSQDWDVLTAWKSAADLLWENGRREKARSFYQEITNRFDKPGAPQIVQIAVRGSRNRLAEPDEATRSPQPK